MARVADALPAVGFYWPIVSAQDHPATAPLHELLASYTSTVKHVQTETVMGATMARYAVEMARVLAGDEATMRSRPPLSALICAIAPLAQDDEGMEAALVLAEAGVPVGFMSMANAGSTGPATIAGTVVQGDAEIVAALTLIQLACPGAPVFHSLMTGVMDPRTGGYLATSPSGEIAYAAGVELAHAWGVPTLAGVYGTDAPVPGWQAAAESAVALTLCALLGAETGSGMGLLDACTLLYPEQLVLDADLHERVRDQPRRARHEPRGARPRRHPRGRSARPLPLPAPHPRRPARAPVLRAHRPDDPRRLLRRSRRGRPRGRRTDPGRALAGAARRGAPCRARAHRRGRGPRARGGRGGDVARHGRPAMTTLLRVLSDEQLAAVHERSLAILERTGVRVDSERARTILAEAGAPVDETTRIVRFPPDLVERSLALAPRRFALGGRRAGFSLPMNEGGCSLVADGEGVHVIDGATGERRPARARTGSG